MAEQSPFSPNTDEKLILDQVLGNAYLTVKFVAQNIDVYKQTQVVYDDLITLGPLASSLELLANEIALLESIDGNYSSIHPVGENISEVISVSGILNEITSLATNISEIQTVSGISTEVTTISPIVDEISTLAPLVNQIQTVVDNISSINTLAGIHGDVTSLVPFTDEITTVAGSVTDVEAVATSLPTIMDLHSAIPTIEQNRDDAVQASISSQASLEAVQLLQGDLVTKTGNLAGLNNPVEALVNLGAIPSIGDLLFNTDNSPIDVTANSLELTLPNKVKVIYKSKLPASIAADNTIILSDVIGSEFVEAPVVIPIISSAPSDYPEVGNEKTGVLRVNASTTDVSGFWYSGNDSDSLTGTVFWGYLVIGKLV